jgi:hypothetical protein
MLTSLCASVRSIAWRILLELDQHAVRSGWIEE